MNMNESEVREYVKKKYGEAARRTGGGGCCGPAGQAGAADPITRDLYAGEQAAEVPAEALAASLGCGNPTALATLHPGETVLDLGSGGGIDVLLSARRVGPTGKAYGLDMTPEMLELARANQRRAGVANAEFLQGTIEAIPLPDASVDVVISNCVINLSTDKARVLREAFRVLKPGGRFAVSDVVLKRRLPEAAERSLRLWTGCVSGALVEDEYRRLLSEAGFTGVEVQPTRVYGAQDIAELLGGGGSCCGVATKVHGVDPQAYAGVVFSAFVRATKPR
ncbi:MAG: arsenite methyltransferase [Planctomycetes bacterium]|nr:arsenite methyltransferase [Planctomycetota bacterium]